MSAVDNPQPTSDQTSRRRLLTLLGGGSAALAATQLPREASAADNDPLILGVPNNATSSTHLQSSNSAGGLATLSVNNVSATGLALTGRAVGGAGVSGHSQSGFGGHFSSDTGDALIANGPSQFNASLEGFAISVNNEQGGGMQLHCGPSEETPAIKANRFANAHTEDAATIVGVTSLPGGFGNGPDIGVLGGAGSGEGVHGHSATGIGVGSSSDSGVGVQGFSQTGVAGWLICEGGGIALRVSGVAEFDHVGFGEVPTGRNSGWVDHPGVTGNSHITVTLTGDPASRTLHWVQRVPGSGFRVHLTAAPPKNRPHTSFSYLVVEPSSG